MTISTDATVVWASDGPREAAMPDASTLRAVVAAVRDGLLRPRKRLPAWLLYDRRGSDLFERITELPGYYLTRTERAILAANAVEMIDAARPPLAVVELGAGTASKTELLLKALLTRQKRVDYRPVDVSATALARAAAGLSRREGLSVRPVAARYPDELDFWEPTDERRLVLFLGSNIGNFSPGEARAFLGAVRRRLAPGDALLVGADLRKPVPELLAAYDDPQGITARFSKNVLERLNRELRADFDIARFRHLVRWNGSASRIEIYLQSERAQEVRVEALGVEIRLRAGERIHTESSYKLSAERIGRLFASAGLRPERSWYDRRRRFGVHLLRVPPGPPRSPVQ